MRAFRSLNPHARCLLSPSEAKPQNAEAPSVLLSVISSWASPGSNWSCLERRGASTKNWVEPVRRPPNLMQRFLASFREVGIHLLALKAGLAFKNQLTTKHIDELSMFLSTQKQLASLTQCFGWTIYYLTLGLQHNLFSLPTLQAAGWREACCVCL